MVGFLSAFGRLLLLCGRLILPGCLRPRLGCSLSRSFLLGILLLRFLFLPIFSIRFCLFGICLSRRLLCLFRGFLSRSIFHWLLGNWLLGFLYRCLALLGLRLLLRLRRLLLRFHNIEYESIGDLLLLLLWHFLFLRLFRLHGLLLLVFRRRLLLRIVGLGRLWLELLFNLFLSLSFLFSFLLF